MAKNEDVKSEEKDLRTRQVEERRKRMVKLKPRAPVVRVVPASDELRRALKHPRGMGFPPDGSAEWPDDRFTRRRIKEGAVTVERPQEEQEQDRRVPRRSSSPLPSEPGA